MRIWPTHSFVSWSQRWKQSGVRAGASKLICTRSYRLSRIVNACAFNLAIFQVSLAAKDDASRLRQQLSDIRASHDEELQALRLQVTQRPALH